MKNSRAKIKASNITIACVGLLISTVVLYLYFLNMSVVQVVIRTEHVQKQHNLNTEIAMLEATYIESQHKIASRIATLEGYNSDTPKVFVSRDQASLVLSSN
tara:strand:- start:557 stop:862 length:306 start_codon:yes stop_codon:yes gene_type:complete